MIVIGLMSGTSADGIDAAVVEIHGAPPRLEWKVLAHRHSAHPPGLREDIFACFRPETGSVDKLCALNFALGRAFGQAALDAIRAAGLTPAQVDLIGSHGQTLWHIPTGEDASTLQLGEPAVISEMTGLPVIANFRVRDMAAGGQGAPLVAYVDYLLFRDARTIRALQNIGGIANVTYLPAYQNAQGEDAAFAFDTGPGNMLIDDAAARITGGALACDLDGRLAARGKIHAGLLAEMLADAYFAQRPPKTTGRELFGTQYGERAWQRAQSLGLSGEDLIATLTELTARSIAQAYRDFLPAQPQEVIVSGGGARNPTLMARLAENLPDARVLTSEAYGLDVEAKEAVAFAVLAYESLHRRPGNLPAATGARSAVILGSATPPVCANEDAESAADGAAALADARTRLAAQLTAPPPTARESGAPSIIRAYPVTEARNPRTERIDVVSTLEMMQMINAEDQRVAQVVAGQLPAIAEAVDRISARMRSGGRLIYTGAGTSGRLGLLDASECPPTFNSSPEQVIGLIAGGEQAFSQAVEGVEDDPYAGALDLETLHVNERDCVVGLAASGRTPFVIGALKEARKRGALTVSIACNQSSVIEELADVAIALVVGPEVLAGSTRMKAGTAQKMTLNLISTGVMIRLGKTYSNLMVDVQATNSKLRQRARMIVAEACGIGLEEAALLLARCGNQVKTAIVTQLAGVTPEDARARLARAGGVTRRALEAQPRD